MYVCTTYQYRFNVTRITFCLYNYCLVCKYKPMKTNRSVHTNVSTSEGNS